MLTVILYLLVGAILLLVFATILSDTIVREKEFFIYWGCGESRRSITMLVLSEYLRMALCCVGVSADVITEISKKYENVQKGVGDIMGGALIETNARKIKNEAKKEIAISMLKIGKMTIEEIAECSELSVAEVEQLTRLQTV